MTEPYETADGKLKETAQVIGGHLSAKDSLLPVQDQRQRRLSFSCAQTSLILPDILPRSGLAVIQTGEQRKLATVQPPPTRPAFSRILRAPSSETNCDRISDSAVP